MPGLSRRPGRLTGPRPGRLPAGLLVTALGLSLLLGAGAGVVWWAVAPDVLVETTAAGPVLSALQAQRLFTVDALFGLVTATAGLGIGVAMAGRHLRRPFALLAVLVTTGLAGSLTAWRVGTALGPGALDPRLEAAEVGERLALPLGLEARGLLLAWPIAAVTGVLLVLAVSPDERIVDPGAPVSPGERSAPSPPR